jgi:heat shock protein HtpX
MGIFFVGIIAIGFVVSQIYNSPGILYGAVLFSVLLNFFSYWFSDKVALSLSGAKPAQKDDFAELHNIVENLAITAGLPKPSVYVISDAAPNAFATGRNKEHASVAVTAGLLSMLDRKELEGVIAHELAHIGNRDILLQTVVVTLVGMVSILADLFTRSLFFGGRDDNQNHNPILYIFGIVFLILSPFAAMVIQLAISRRREYLADATGALLTRYPEGLASALQKISSYTQPLRTVHNSTAHLFISDPYGKKRGAGQFIAGLFATHPPAEERIKRLREMAL